MLLECLIADRGKWAKTKKNEPNHQVEGVLQQFIQ